MPTELPKLSPVEYRRRAEDAAERSDRETSVMWSLLAIASDLAEIRHEMKRRR